MQRAWRSAATILLAALAVTGCKRQQTSFVAPPPPQVVVAQPLHQSVTPYLEATGNLTAYNQVDLVARVSGFLQSIDYTDGAIAHRGQTLFIIEPAPYQAKLQQAQAALQSAQAQASQTDAEYQRQASLGRTDYSSRSTVDQALAARDSNRANVLNDQAGGDAGGDQPRLYPGHRAVRRHGDGTSGFSRQPGRCQWAHEAGHDRAARSDLCQLQRQ